MSKLETKVLEVVRKFGVMHPRELESHFGNTRVINAWGGYSKATTHALDHLHYRGLLRIARREKGIRIFEAAPRSPEEMSPAERLRKLMMVFATILAPVPETSLLGNLARYRALGNARAILRDLLSCGELEKQIVDGIVYLWPHVRINHEAPRSVRFLAPFDPVVWDRRRFEHLWGWRYRFEAYTPVAKRLRGYYAMPLLWRDRVIGWANARVEGKRLNVEFGFVEKRPHDSDFRGALDEELHRLEAFLGLD